MPRKPSIPADRIPALSDLQASGHTYKELADLEHTTPSTVQRHVERYRLTARAEDAESECTVERHKTAFLGGVVSAQLAQAGLPGPEDQAIDVNFQEQ